MLVFVTETNFIPIHLVGSTRLLGNMYMFLSIMGEIFHTEPEAYEKVISFVKMGLTGCGIKTTS